MLQIMTLAVGLFVDYISKSPIWKESAIFILEDDAQNGPDHVDAHRSPAYLISPYVKKVCRPYHVFYIRYDPDYRTHLRYETDDAV